VKTSRLLFGGLVLSIIVVGGLFLSGTSQVASSLKESAISDLGFTPSGWMGDYQDVTFADNYEKQANTMKITYTPRGENGWAGIYWLYPSSNWGDQPGRDLRGYQKVSFSAKGDRGNETVEFLVGGVDTEKQFKDSIQPAISRTYTLKPDWEYYEIPLSEAADISSVIGGFAWLIDTKQGGKASTFYLRDIAVS
jgi:hypothetical protein